MWISVEDELPPNDEPVSVKVLMRYKRYKPTSDQHKKGLIGRWQEFNGYGWSNCNAPNDWQPITEPPTN